MSTDVVSAAMEPVSAAVAQASGPGSDPSPKATPSGPASAAVTFHDATAIAQGIHCAPPSAPVFLHSPPDSNNAAKSDASDSELSELEDEPVLEDAPSATIPAPTSASPSAPPPSEATKGTEEKEKDTEEEEDIGEVLPEDWSGAVPIFRPSWHQFKDFKKFMKKVDRYGMKSGIIKIIPPAEWKDTQPPLDELVKHIRVREPIKQDIMGFNGTYRQVNILHGRSYNVPQWRQLCDQSEHQPPARRGERRANADKARAARQRPLASKPVDPSTPKRRGRGRPAKNKGKKTSDGLEERPMTPVSPKPDIEADDMRRPVDEPVDSIEAEDIGEEAKDTAEESSCGRSDSRVRGIKASRPKTQTVSARRKYSRREGSAMIDEAAFKDFDYRMDVSDYTPERCEELERAYWKTLTYAPPLYGADMMGTLFDDRTETWNLNKLPNLLDVLGTKIPGVNTAYLYLGMWKATFAWHLEDVDLYSINYLHFGAPKQWYSISQADARRFEEAMKSVWPADAKACNQFLRHKGFLISPHHLLQHYGIKVNKVVSYPGEFVVTYPYGYHSGYNLGYNCAEAVNFALDTWLEMGKIAKKCECAQAQDSVWINVHEIERKLRGEETEYEETDDDDGEDDNDEELSGLPSPPASQAVKLRDKGRKRKRMSGDKDHKPRVKKIRLRLKARAEPPCCLCPNDISHFDLLQTDDGRKAHKVCALYLPETYIDSVDGKEVVCNVGGVHKDRLSLKCLYCRSRRGACFQCSHKKCARGYHATCASAAGVFVEDQDVPVFDDSGVEYKEQAFEFSCRFHRSRRDKKLDSEALESDMRIRHAANRLGPTDFCQMQYLRGEIFAGIVVENRHYEETVLIEVLPHCHRVEVEWKWLIVPDSSDYRLPKASAGALPLPASRKAKKELNAKRATDGRPRKDDVFAEGYTWAEFETLETRNEIQSKVDFEKPDQIWHYLGKTSTEARAQFTEDPQLKRHNPKGNFLESIPKPPRPVPPLKPPVYQHHSYIAKAMAYSYNLAANHVAATTGARPGSIEKPYVYKPRNASGGKAALLSAPTRPVTCTDQGTVPYSQPQQHDSHGDIHHQQRQDFFISSEQAPSQTYSNGASNGGDREASHETHLTSQQKPQCQQQPVHYGQQQHQRQQNNLTQFKHSTSHQSTKPAWQVYMAVYQKYPFFLVNHNRDSSKYRTPYCKYGGFGNGYELNSIASSVAFGYPAAAPGADVHIASPTASTALQSATQLTGIPIPQAPGFTMMPAAKSSKARAVLTNPRMAARSNNTPVTQFPPKVSPVPLPPHVVAALAKTTPVTPKRLFNSGGTGVPVATLVNPARPTSTKLWQSPPRSQHVAPEPSVLSRPEPEILKSASDTFERPRPRPFEPTAVRVSLAQKPEPRQEFADVPGSESMQFMETMMQNLRRASMNGEVR